MEDVLRRIADHVANEGSAGVLAVLAKRLRCKVRDLEYVLTRLGYPANGRELQDESREMLQKKILFHLPRQIANAKVEQLQPRAIGDRDTPLQEADPFDVFESGFGLLPDGVASSRPPPKDKRQR